MLGKCANVRMCKCANCRLFLLRLWIAWEMCKCLVNVQMLSECANVRMCKLSPLFAAFVDSLVNAQIGVSIRECKSTYT